MSDSLSGSDVLLIVPPFSSINRPSLGVHLLQACARERGVNVDIFYANLLFASTIGAKQYIALCFGPQILLGGERLFARTAYGVPPLGHNKDEVLRKIVVAEDFKRNSEEKYNLAIPPSDLLKFEKLVPSWVDKVASDVAARDYKIVGATTMFEQTAAAISLLNAVKERNEEITTIIGGPNCEEEMAEGIASLTDSIDYIFSGESEETFIRFLQQYAAGTLPSEKIIYGSPCQNMEALPPPDYEEYYQQLKHYLPKVAEKPAHIILPYETSRGCWWGQKHHCTFCGLNGLGMGFREKSAEKSLRELRHLLKQHPSGRVQMSDNIMPYTFFKSLVPDLKDLAQEVPDLTIYYEQKANLSLEQVIALKEAGINHIQPGIEALSTSLLRRMDKGVTAKQNIALLRYARSTGIAVDWNLLWKFPGDELYEYEEILELAPLMHHLEPPSGFFPLSIDRFSPYYDEPERYGLTNIRPWHSYAQLLPHTADVDKVAYHFIADYESASGANLDMMREIEEAIFTWQEKWKDTHVTFSFGTVQVKEQPILEVTQCDDGTFLLRDTRPSVDNPDEMQLTQAQASAVLAPRRYEPNPEIEWAIQHKFGVVLDEHHYVPLATADPELILAFESSLSQRKPTLSSKKRSIPVPVATPDPESIAAD